MLLRASEVAVALNVRRVVVYDMARTGRLPCVRLGRQVRFHPVRLMQWVWRGGEGAVVN